ncbi:MAG: tRNA threonylcarbamoyladenosine biosynthesis protein TsaB [Methylophagaceae bacterium]|jgi:tRNA threonylcarbamoyladenosine biosynthesis protein TsaB
MNILALDTCSEMCSTALLFQGKRYELTKKTQRGHSDLVLGMMDNLFEQSASSLSDVDVLAFGRGPGSFTGVRVGVSVAQGIAFAREIPVVPISSLAAVAQKAADEIGSAYIAVAMDARMGEIYCAHYHYDGKSIRLLNQERVCNPTDFVPYHQGACVGVGTAWSVYETQLQANFGRLLSHVEANYYPEAVNVITLAEDEILAGNLLRAEQALPVYLRDNVAKKKAEQGG